MKNKLTDLNNYLFEQIELLNDSDLDSEEMEKQIKKAEMISKISKSIIEVHSLQLDAIKAAADNGVVSQNSFRSLLGVSKDE